MGIRCHEVLSPSGVVGKHGSASQSLSLRNVLESPIEIGGDLASMVSLLVGETGSGEYDTLEGTLSISFPNPRLGTNHFTLNLAKLLKLGDVAPGFSIRDVFSDTAITKVAYEGKLLVLKFWTTTCAPCQPEMEELNQLMARRHGDWDDRVAVIAVSLDDDRQKVVQRIRDRGWTALRQAWTSPKESGSRFDSEVARDYGIISNTLWIRGASQWGYPLAKPIGPSGSPHRRLAQVHSDEGGGRGLPARGG